MAFGVVTEVDTLTSFGAGIGLASLAGLCRAFILKWKNRRLTVIKHVHTHEWLC